MSEMIRKIGGIAMMSLFSVNAVAGKEKVIVDEEVVEMHRQSINANFEGIPEWFRDAKLGIYMHWSPVTYAIRDAKKQWGWYGRYMYEENNECFSYHQENYGDQKTFGYKDIVPLFTAPKWDPNEIAKMLADAGAKYAGPVAVHHDNFLMWDSDVSPWNSMDMGPKRDISGELETAIRKQGMKFMGSFHHAMSWNYFHASHAFDGADPATWDLYCEPHERSDRPTQRHINFVKDTVLEFVNKYHPDLVFFETGTVGFSSKETYYSIHDEYYKAAKQWGKEVITTSKQGDFAQLAGQATVEDFERGRKDYICKEPWQTDTCPSSWFWYGGYDTAGAGRQSSDQMVDLLIDVVSKNGNMLLGVPPTADGGISPRDQLFMKELGAWLRVNGEGIYATRPWRAYGEGLAREHVEGANTQADEETISSTVISEEEFTSRDIRYTESKDGKTLYAFLMAWPENSEIKLRLPKLTGQGKVELFGHGAVEHQVDPKSGHLTIQLPTLDSNDQCQFAYGFKINGYGISTQPDGIYHVAGSVERRTADQGVANENSMTLMNGYEGEPCIAFSKKRGDNNEVSFLVNAIVSGDYYLRMRLYSAGKNELTLVVNGKELTATVEPSPKNGAPVYVDFGKVHLDAGTYHLKFKRPKFKKSSKSGLHVYGVEMAQPLEALIR